MTKSIGLHERKKRAAMRRIQECALDLFDERGYEFVTVEQIAQAAEVSPSSIYRYFGTKERVVLYDELDIEFLTRVDAELVDHPPVEAVRRALAVVMATFFDRESDLARRKTRYALSEPALQSAMTELTEGFVEQVKTALARAAGRPTDELEIEVVATALVWALVAATRHWHAGGYRASLAEEMEASLAILERGLR